MLEARLGIVLLPLTPLLAVSLLYPASAVLSDSLAASQSLPVLLIVVLGFIAGAFVEYKIVGSVLSAAIAPIFAAVVLTTHGQDLLSATSHCNSLCIAHNVLLVLYAALELGACRLRGASLALTITAAVVMIATAVAYRIVLVDDDFDASVDETRVFLAMVGALELVLFLAARTITALADYEESSWFFLR